MQSTHLSRAYRALFAAFVMLTSVGAACTPAFAAEAAPKMQSPVPLLEKGRAVDWWFVFKFNSKFFPGCSGQGHRACPFGGEPQAYQTFGQQFVYASSTNAELQEGKDCLGDETGDPVGATFDEIYNGAYNYVVWNDQFYEDPQIQGCGTSCGSPWGHSKGMLAWGSDGSGLVIQVTTPSWPAAASKKFPRQTDGNTLGCVRDNDVKVSQHFFGLKLSADDVGKVLRALGNASVVTDPTNKQVVNVSNSPKALEDLALALGKKSTSTAYLHTTLSSGVELISKPSRLAVPSWQFLSAVLGGPPLRAATWWATPKIYSTDKDSTIRCWDPRLPMPGPVEIATTGHWHDKTFGLAGGPGSDFNHAKIGVSQAANDNRVIFADLNQQGALSGDNCKSSQNGRGGLFYVINDAALHKNISALIAGDKAPTSPPP